MRTLRDRNSFTWLVTFTAMLSLASAVAHAADHVMTFGGDVFEGDIHYTGGSTLMVTLADESVEAIDLDDVAAVRREFTRSEKRTVGGELDRLEDGLEKHDVAGQYGLGLLALVYGDAKLAEKCFKRVIKEDETHAGARLHLGHVLEDGEWERDRDREKLIDATAVVTIDEREGGDRTFFDEDGPSIGGLGKAERSATTAWEDYGGWQCTIEGEITLRTNISEASLDEMVDRIRNCRAFYASFLEIDPITGWTVSVFAKRDEYNAYSREIGKPENVQGICVYARKECLVCDTNARGGYMQVVSHEFLHAHYETTAPMWLGEGISTFFEVSTIENGRGEIQINEARANEAKIYIIDRGHYHEAFARSMRGESQDGDGYGESYGVSWSIIYFLWQRDADKLKQTFKEMQNARRGTDNSLQMERIWGVTVDELNEAWMEFVKSLK